MTMGTVNKIWTSAILIRHSNVTTVSQLYLHLNRAVLPLSDIFDNEDAFLSSLGDSSSAGSRDSKMSIESILQNLSGSNRSSRYSSSILFFEYYEFRHTSRLAYNIVWK